MADAAKTAQLAQGAEKKAARRAAFIQEIAEAVKGSLNASTPIIRAPFAAAVRRWEAAERAADDKAGEDIEALGWAKYMRLLPADATELPSEEVQQYLLDLHNRQAAKAT